jgi:polysaccharide biosynthesis protein PslG
MPREHTPCERRDRVPAGVSALCALVLACCAPPPEPRPPQADDLVWKPVSFAVLEDYDKGASLEGIARDFALMRRLGAPTWRGSFGWDDYEPEPGVYDLAWLERFVALAADSGIALRPYLGYTPEWAAAGGEDAAAWNDPPADLAAWASFVDTMAATVGRYDHVLSWEIYNEENVEQWWDGTVAEYNRVLRTAADRIRERDPDAVILMGGLVWPDEDWMRASCVDYGNADAFDVAAFHAYPETWTPESIDVEEYLGPQYRAAYLPAIRVACGGKRVWMNEIGFATTPGRTEAEQASWWVRAVATFLAEPGVEHIGVYELNDLPRHRDAIGDEPNYHLGLVRTDGKPKLAFHTVEMLVDLLATDSLAVVDEEIEWTIVEGRPSAVHGHLFVRPDGAQVGFLWTEGGEATVDVRLVRPVGAVRTAHLDGSWRPFAGVEGRTLRNVRLVPGVPVVLRADRPG